MSVPGYLQALITVPTDGWDFTVTDGGGAINITVPAGTYYLNGPSSAYGDNVEGLINNILDQLEAANPGVYSFAMNTDGTLTLANSGGNFTVTWTDTEIRDLLGWAADVGSTASTTGPEQAEAVWLPDCSVETMHASVQSAFDEWRGKLVSDFVAVEHPSGMSTTYSYNASYERRFAWPLVSRAKIWEAEAALANASWEKFVEGAICGRYVWAKPGGPIQWHNLQTFSQSVPDASDAPSQYKVPPESIKPPEPVTGGYTGLWRVEIPRAVLLPSLVDA